MLLIYFSLLAIGCSAAPMESADWLTLSLIKNTELANSGQAVAGLSADFVDSVFSEPASSQDEAEVSNVPAVTGLSSAFSSQSSDVDYKEMLSEFGLNIDKSPRPLQPALKKSPRYAGPFRPRYGIPHSHIVTDEKDTKVKFDNAEVLYLDGIRKEENIDFEERTTQLPQLKYLFTENFTEKDRVDKNAKVKGERKLAATEARKEYQVERNKYELYRQSHEPRIPTYREYHAAKENRIYDHWERVLGNEENIDPRLEHLEPWQKTVSMEGSGNGGPKRYSPSLTSSSEKESSSEGQDAISQDCSVLSTCGIDLSEWIR
jgi:hypothetical protein